MRGSTVPLLGVALVMLFKGGAQRLKECRNRVVLCISKSKAKCESAVSTYIDFPGERYIAVTRVTEFPVHLKVSR